MQKFNSVLIVAGTHGNELSGIYLHKLIKKGLFPVDRATFSTSSVIANPKAVQHNTRYIDTDLNREFASKGADNDSNTHESELARQFADRHAQKSQQLVVDLHNTTSNMGATLILLSNDIFYQKMGAYVQQRMPEANILFEERKSWDAQPYLCTMGTHGVMIEVGSQAHGALTYRCLEEMKQMLSTVLDYVEKHNLRKVGTLEPYSAFFYTEEVTIPLDQDGLREAIVHPTVCGRDFEVVKPGEALLATFAGYDIHWQGKEDIYPHFINESAYNKSHIAMALAEKRLVSLK